MEKEVEHRLKFVVEAPEHPQANVEFDMCHSTIYFLGEAFGLYDQNAAWELLGMLELHLNPAARRLVKELTFATRYGLLSHPLVSTLKKVDRNE